jgi:2,3,4,5-tetrahydropyridine-2-carboxylate N-succinyltransferase
MLDRDFAQHIEDLYAQGDKADALAARGAFVRLRDALGAGDVRAAEPDPSSPTGWRCNPWVKQGILLGFRFGRLVDQSMDHGRLAFFDKDTMPLKALSLDRHVRLVPGGSAIREGAFIG